MSYPEGHAWGLALFLEPADPELMWRLADRPYVTLPDDLKHFPDQEEGLVFEVLDRVCVKCWQRFDMSIWQPCAADTSPQHHLHGGVMAERAARSKPAPGTTAAEVAARQARARQKKLRREAVALMQASRLDGLN
ncbi:hypothetical protein [Nonomuraea sp. JJY05]|uniref:hypothetical protein n=1 Tax=Nonomuraea sp. JJY05 TaxID=3350255 RepID=UPI00373F2051